MPSLLANLKSVCAAYHKKDTTALTQNGVDLFLVAANNAIRNAQLRHNFEYCRVAATLSIGVPAGGSLGDAVVTESSGYGTFGGIREVVAVTRESSAGYQLPVDFTRADMALERERTILDQDSDCWPVNRYPSDADLLRRGGYGGVVQRGSRLFIYPAPNDSDNSVAVVLQGYGWLAEYTATDLTPTGVIVTGTLTPDSTGTYSLAGTDSGSGVASSIWVRMANNPFYVAWSGGHYRLSSLTDTGTWVGPVSFASPAGTYTASTGATGTATITLSSPSSDFFLLYGSSFLQWEIIVELNFFFKTFVPREEGNLASPEKNRDAAWNALLEWDSYLVDSNVTKYRG